MTTRLTEAELNRTTLARQRLLTRSHDDVPGVVRAVGGLQAQHADMPYVGLWSRRAEQTIAGLEAALTDRHLVKATVMRSTLHLVRAQDWPVLDAVSAEQRLAAWRPSAGRAGVDLAELNVAVRRYCAEPRTVDEIEAFAAERHRGVDPTAAVPGGVSRPWWRLASAGGGLVHVPPSGLWRSHAAPRYLDGRVWLADALPGSSRAEEPEADVARAAAVDHYLRAFGPASRGDVARGLGILRATPLKRARALLDLRVLEGPDGRELLDVADGETVEGDVPAPVRFLPRWDHLLVALEDRSRFLDAATAAGVYRRNGDVLPTFWTGGRVAGTWVVDVEDERATLRLSALGRAPSGSDRDALEAEGAGLIAYVTPEATERAVTWEGEGPRAARASGRARR
jgi:hypothetical protein